jgi:predicted flavoprotein YhiN
MDVERGAAGFVVKTKRAAIAAASLVVACGGLSVPKMGATGFGYDIAKRFGHRLVPTRAGLVPLVFGPDDLVRYKDLSGVSLPVQVRVSWPKFLQRDAVHAPWASAARRYCKFRPIGRLAMNWPSIFCPSLTPTLG